uniref:Atos homolog B n=1 Tax=Sphenodon punctatus TaxID=8508 RepID=A0A8D0H082_SPHPU
MRHIHAEVPLPQEHRGGTGSGQEEEAAVAAAESEPDPCRRGVLMGYSPAEITRQKVYQVSIFSPVAGSSQPAELRAPGRQPFKRPCPEGGWDPKRARWGEQEGLDEDAVEDGLVVEELSLGGSAQHFSHSGLQVVEHRREGSPSWAGGQPRASRAPCSTLHTRDCAPASPPSGRPRHRKENGARRDEGSGSQNLLDLDLHNLTQRPPGAETPGGSNGHAEPSTPHVAPGTSANGLGSAEKTPCAGSRLPAGGTTSTSTSSGCCPAKRKLLPSDEGLADTWPEEESRSPAQKKRALLGPSVPASCRSTDAKGAPFWNHLLPAAKGSPDCTTLGRRLKSGLRLKPRHLFSSLRKGPVAARPLASAWAATSISRALLGNFEESILKGRFAPSGRIEGFTAEIGASGSYCPQHVTLPVEVTYFDIAEHSAPSPFLGVIDLEALGKKGYSVPKAGTIQVTLFNPNKTVVKMFLVTYDFQDMPAGHVTFLRHRIFLVPVGAEERPGDEEAPKRVLCYLMHLR